MRTKIPSMSAWNVPMPTSDEATLGVFEKKILRKVFESLHVGNGDYRRRWYNELYELYDGIDIAQRIKIRDYVGWVMSSEWIQTLRL